MTIEFTVENCCEKDLTDDEIIEAIEKEICPQSVILLSNSFSESTKFDFDDALIIEDVIFLTTDIADVDD